MIRIPLSLLLLGASLAVSADSCQAPTDADGDGFTPEDGDCDDGDPAVHPEAEEPCDGADSDCDLQIDEGCAGPVAGPTDGSLLVDARLDAEGVASPLLTGVDLAGSVGALEVRGAPHQAVAYHRVDWQEAGYVLHGVLSIAEPGDDLAVSWLYCEGASLSFAYSESFSHALLGASAEGACVEEVGAAPVDVALPALTALPPPFDSGFEISGPHLELDGDLGWIDLAGQRYELRPFSDVDCATCPGGPWYEVHSLLSREGEACFAILYLFPDRPATAQLSYSLCLPTLTEPAGPGVSYAVSWSGAPRRLAASGPVAPGAPLGVPPPASHPAR